MPNYSGLPSIQTYGARLLSGIFRLFSCVWCGVGLGGCHWIQGNAPAVCQGAIASGFAFCWTILDNPCFTISAAFTSLTDDSCDRYRGLDALDGRRL